VDIYAKLFTRIDSEAKAYIEANRAATTPEISGFDPNLVELLEVPAKVKPACVLDTAHLELAAQKIPQLNNKVYAEFLFDAINQLELTHPGATGRAMVVTDSSSPHNSPIFIRGEALNRGPIVPRRFLEILAGRDRKPFTIGSGRLELAQCIATKNNPLTARV